MRGSFSVTASNARPVGKNRKIRLIVIAQFIYSAYCRVTRRGKYYGSRSRKRIFAALARHLLRRCGCLCVMLSSGGLSAIAELLALRSFVEQRRSLWPKLVRYWCVGYYFHLLVNFFMLCIRAFQFGQKKFRFDSIQATESIFSIRFGNLINLPLVHK